MHSWRPQARPQRRLGWLVPCGSFAVPPQPDSQLPLAHVAQNPQHSVLRQAAELSSAVDRRHLAVCRRGRAAEMQRFSMRGNRQQQIGCKGGGHAARAVCSPGPLQTPEHSFTRDPIRNRALSARFRAGHPAQPARGTVGAALRAIQPRRSQAEPGIERQAAAAAAMEGEAAPRCAAPPPLPTPCAPSVLPAPDCSPVITNTLPPLPSTCVQASGARRPGNPSLQQHSAAQLAAAAARAVPCDAGGRRPDAVCCSHHPALSVSKRHRPRHPANPALTPTDRTAGNP